MGYGVSDTYTVRNQRDREEKLVVSDPIRTCNRTSWLCYYKALQMGNASKVVPIDKLSVVITLILAFVFLHEEFTMKSIIGCVLIGLGTLLMVL